MSKEGSRPLNPGHELELAGCARLLHQMACRQKMFMVLASHENATRTVMAGLLASQYAWQEFGPTLDGLLSQEPKLGDFLTALDSVGIAGIYASASQVHPGAVPGVSGESHPAAGHGGPCLVCFEQCVTEAARRLEPAPKGETVSFIMDWADASASSALWHLEYLRDFSAPCLQKRLGTLGFESASVFDPLLAARWLACAISDQTPHTTSIAPQGPLKRAAHQRSKTLALV